MYGGYILGTSATRPIPLRIESQPAFKIGNNDRLGLAEFHRLLHLALRRARKHDDPVRFLHVGDAAATCCSS